MSVVKGSLFLLVAILASAIFNPTYAQPSKTSDSTKVYTIEDKTKESGCLYWIRDGAPTNDITVPADAQSCKPGSILQVHESTLADVKRQRIKNYVLKTNDMKADKANIRRMSEQMLRVGEPSRITAECSAVGDRTYSYVYGAGSDTSILVQVSYRIATTCIVSNIKDRVKLSSSGRTRCWTDTAFSSGGGSYFHGIVLDENIYRNTYTNWQSGYPTRTVGNYYYNETNTALTAPPPSPPFLYCDSTPYWLGSLKLG